LSPYFNCAGNRHVEPVAAIESFDEALHFSAGPVECQRMVYWARIDVDLVGLVRIAADVGATTDFDPVQHWPVRDNHGLHSWPFVGRRDVLAALIVGSSGSRVTASSLTPIDDHQGSAGATLAEL
jgi:hypothetical protein